MPVETPVKDPTITVTPSKPLDPRRQPSRGPERYYNPERLCPDQGRDSGWRTAPGI